MLNPSPSDPALPAARGSVLLVEDDGDQAAILQAMLEHEGLDVTIASTGEQGLAAHRRSPADVVVTDLVLPGMSGLDLIRGLAAKSGEPEELHVPAPAVVLMTGSASVASAVEALRLGATDYLQKPFDPQRLVALVREILRAKPARGIEPDDLDAPDDAHVFEGMIADSPAMREVFRRIERVAPTSAPVLIVGESGTGKELVARAVHARSPRRSGPLVPVHTGAIPRELIGSELFGHEKGSFTGAFAAAEGKFEAAAGGSVFLDEVGTMDSAVQVSLLRVLESYRFTRVGGRKVIDADVRIIAATNKDLLDLVDEHVFREDLYYRLNVFTITLPPLRERGADVVLMADRFLLRFARRYQTAARRFSPEAKQRLLEHDWPGNVRELRNAIEQTALFAPDEVVQREHLQLGQGRLERRHGVQVASSPPEPASAPASRAEPVPIAAAPEHRDEPASSVAVAARPHGSVSAETPIASASLGAAPHTPAAAQSTPPAPPAGIALPQEPDESADHPLVLRLPVGTRLADAERELILMTLNALHGNKQRVARVLGISRRGLYSKLQAFGLHVARSEAGEVEEGGDERTLDSDPPEPDEVLA